MNIEILKSETSLAAFLSESINGVDTLSFQENDIHFTLHYADERPLEDRIIIDLCVMRVVDGDVADELIDVETSVDSEDALAKLIFGALKGKF
ncbi:hypothetical protein N9L75_03545 [Porticoccaceae bacterium]|nr:hypothetical protein [Porticoccaceae bacterium]MDA8651629.1 hypothetical protein [Porticoccaceae bacterium]MDA8682427.1 hypothetical protein [Porticoccaceae bacterium]MDB2664434.1 hypothetical protein [Porticoccaceae bacterium]